MQNLEDVAMLPKYKKKIKYIVGNLDLMDGPYDIFDNKVILFLNEISKEILKSNKTRQFPDLISFGFWCRISNLKKIYKNYNIFNNRIGRGTILHITPSNVPTNFAYSMVFGLLSGNNNIIRLPSKNFDQVRILCDILQKISKKKVYKQNFKKFALIKYENSDSISSDLSKIVDARVIWGGDNTINKFKKYYTKPRCIDLTFADRYSISIIDSNQLQNLNDQDFISLIQKFYNDTYTMDQFGCSSPNSVFWLGKNEIVKKKFWLYLNKIVNNKYNLDLSGANKKISNLMNLSLNKNQNFKLSLNNLNLIKFKNKKINLENINNINYGTFVEINLSHLNHLKRFVSEKLQTVTYYGITFDQIKKFIIKKEIKGIDRIIPIGRAFDLTPEWDGIDIISVLSRTLGR